MFSALATCLVMMVHLANNAQIQPPPGVPGLPGMESFRREHLKHTHRGIALVEDMIESDEIFLKEFPDLLSPDRVIRMRKGIVEMRAELVKMKRLEEELIRWEEERKVNPGLDTDRAALERLEKLHKELWPPPAIAPMPHEVKK
jgi:hypothetical protein